MTVTPSFSVSQDIANVFVKIHVPYIRVGASTFYICGTEFHFSCSPYLLHLSLPFSVLDEEGNSGDDQVPRLVEEVGSGNVERRQASACYDPNDNHGTLVVTLPKQIPGQYFPDLDLITKLLMKDDNLVLGRNNLSNTATRPLIVAIEEEDKIEETIEQEEPPLEPLPSLFNVGEKKYFSYGFLQLYHGVFEGLKEEIIQSQDGLLELPYPPEQITQTVDERRRQRLQMEDNKFDLKRFLQDLNIGGEEEGDMVYLQAVQMVPHWQLHKPQNSSSCSPDDLHGISEKLSSLNVSHNLASPMVEDCFNAQERDTLSRIGVLHRNKRTREQKTNYSDISLADQQSLMLGLLDLLFAYCYDHRLTGGDPSCESAWTVSILSPMLSWLECYNLQDVMAKKEPIMEVICYSVRRSLIYPYVRNFDFAVDVILEDVIHILLDGKRAVLRCLLAVRSILEHTTSDTYHYLLNTIFVDDYCVWMQFLADETLNTFAQQVRQEVDVTKSRNWANERHLFTRLDLESIEPALFDKVDDGISCETEQSTSSSDGETDSSSARSSEKITPVSGITASSQLIWEVKEQYHQI